MTADKLVNIRRPTGAYHIVIHIGEQQHVISDRLVIAKLQRQLSEAMEGIVWNESVRD
jgi:hypothetical protein